MHKHNNTICSAAHLNQNQTVKNFSKQIFCNLETKKIQKNKNLSEAEKGQRIRLFRVDIAFH